MKNCLHLISLCLVANSVSLAQNVSTYGPYPKIADDLVNHTYLTDDYILLNKYKPSKSYKGAKNNDYTYHILDLGSNSGFVSKKINLSHNGKSGDVFQQFLADQHIIEFVFFTAPVGSNAEIGVVKRDRKSLEVDGDIKILDENVHFSILGPNASVQRSSKGYVYTRVVGDSYYVSYLDNDFNEIRKIPLTDGAYKNLSTEQQAVDIHSHSPIRVNEYDEVLVTKITSDLNHDSIRSFHFTLINPEGETFDVNPIFERTKGMRGLSANYLHDKKEIEILVQYGKEPKMKGFDIIHRADEGYYYYKCNLEGKILASNTKSFSIDEVYNQYKDDLLKKYSEKKLGDDILSNFSTSRIIYTAEGNYLLINRLTWNPELIESTFIVKTDKEGNLLWTKMLASKIQNPLTNFTLTPGNDLSILLQDLNSTNSGNWHEVNVSKKYNAKEPASLFKVVLDKKDADLMKNDPIELDLPEGSKIQSVHFTKENQKYLIESLSGKEKLFTVFSF